MKIRDFGRYILFIPMLLILVACNSSEQDDVSVREETSIGSETFNYSSQSVSLIANTSNLNIFPVLSTTASYSILPALPSGISISAATGVISGTPIATSSETLYIVTATTLNGKEYAQITLTVTDEPPKTIAYQYSTLDFTKDINLTYSLTTTTGGTPTSYSVNPTLPTGLTLNGTSGDLGGTPTATNSGFYTVTATNSAGSASTTVLINIADSIPTGLTYSNDAQAITTYSALTTMAPSLTNTPDDVDYRITPNLPAGLTLDTDTGSISGTPTAINGVTNYTVTAYNASGETSTVITMTITDPARSLTYAISEIEMQQGVPIVGVPIDTYLGGSSPVYTCTNCPTGISVNATTGLISGTTADAVGTGTMTITATYIAAVTYNITYKIVEDYPEDSTTLGYADTYTFYVGNAVNITPSTLAGGNVSSYELVDESYGGAYPTYNLPINGLTYNYVTGTISGTPTGAADATFVIEGFNLDETATAVKRAEQSVQIKVEVLAPQTLGYLDVPPVEYNAVTQIIELTEGIPLAATISPNPSGGTPDLYTVVPQLPDGLSLNPTNGDITGTPTESLPVTYYTFTGSNDGGSYSETLAISTDQLSAPVSITYDGPNDLTFAIFTYQEEAVTYVGSKATFTVSPALPLGLNINPNDGMIYGTPIVAFTGTQVYTITATNGLGTLSQNINMQITNLAAANLSYYAASGFFNAAAGDDQFTARFTEGDEVTNLNVLHDSDYDPTNPATSAGYIETYTDISADELISDLGLTLDASTGDITGTIQQDAGLDRELNIAFIKASMDQFIIQGTNANGSINNAGDNFKIIVLEEEPDISYDEGFGTNVVVVQGSNASATTGGENDDDAQFFDVANAGGLVADMANGAGVTNQCTVTEISSLEGEAGVEYDIDQEVQDYYTETKSPYSQTITTACAAGGVPCATYNAGVEFTFEGTNCSFRFNANKCFNDDTNGNGKTGDTKTYSVIAKNSGTFEDDDTTNNGVTTTLTVHFYDGPNFVYEPDGNGLDSNYVFFGEQHLTLDGLAGDSVAPYTTNLCHLGDYSLDDVSDLPTPFTFDASDGSIDIANQSILGKRTFTLTSTETNSGLSLTQSENISVQANHIETNGGDADHTFETIVGDLNLDGADDIIVKSELCDDFSCTTNTTSIYIQDTTVAGKFDGVNLAAPSITSAGITSITPLNYGAGKAGIIYVNNQGDDMGAYSTTDAAEYLNSTNDTNSNIALSADGYGVVPMEVGTASDFGVITHDGVSNDIVINQFTILGAVLDDSDNAVHSAATSGIIDSQSNHLLTVADDASGGIDVETAAGSIHLVTFDDTDGDGFNDAIIAYLDDDGANTKICVLNSDGTDFNTVCSPRLDVPNDGVVKDIKFEDITGDGLNEMFILSNDSGTSNTVYIYENKTSTFPGLFQNIDLINLDSGSAFVDFDVADVNNDGRLDIITNDLQGDLDNDGTPENFVTGMSIYYHSNTADIYQNAIKTEDEKAFFYMRSAGSSNLVEIINSSGVNLLYHCGIDTDNASTTSNGTTTLTTYLESTCGVVGAL